MSYLRKHKIGAEDKQLMDVRKALAHSSLCHVLV